jgi:hypothetical protein
LAYSITSIKLGEPKPAMVKPENQEKWEDLSASPGEICRVGYET